jgi:hypothetical protein
MTEQSNDKWLKQVKTNLTSANQAQVLTIIEELRNSGKTEVLPILIDLLHTSVNNDVKANIIHLLNDLKVQSAASYLVNAAIDPQYQTEQQILVSACWQSGLDFSAFTTELVHIAISGNFVVSIEVLTVIENNLNQATSQKRKEASLIIKNYLPKASEEKKPVLLEIMKLLQAE